jgi:hypothetical protein
VKLVDLEVKVNHKMTFDFHSQIQDRLGQIGLLASAPTQRSASGLEHYLGLRLAGVKGGIGWLDSLPFSLAAKFCEMLGVTITLGATPNLKTLPDNEWAKAGEAGFQVCRGGVASVKECLRDLQTESGRGTLNGMRRSFGRLYEWLAYSDAELEPVREVVRDHILDTMPIPKGTVLLGRKQDGVKVHSVQSLSRVYGAHPKTVRRLAGQLGLLPEGHAETSDNKILMPAEVIVPAMTAITTGMSPAELYEALGVAKKVGVPIRQALFDPIPNTGGNRPRYHPNDVVAFLAELEANAVRVVDLSEDHVSVAKVGTNSRASALSVVRMIRSRQIKWIGYRDAIGLDRLIVSRHEVRSLLRELLPGQLRVADLSARMNITLTAAQGVIAAGVVKTVPNPVSTSGRPARLVDSDVMDKLECELISVGALAGDGASAYDRYMRRKALEAKGIMPIPEWLEYGAIVFRRSEIV